MDSLLEHACFPSYHFLQAMNAYLISLCEMLASFFLGFSLSQARHLFFGKDRITGRRTGSRTLRHTTPYSTFKIFRFIASVDLCMTYTQLFYHPSRLLGPHFGDLTSRLKADIDRGCLPIHPFSLGRTGFFCLFHLRRCIFLNASYIVRYHSCLQST